MSEVETVAPTAESKEVKEASTEEAVSKKEEASKEEFSKEDVERAFQLIAQGKRNILCGEIPDAVNQFQEATKILAGKYGETAKECGDAYLCYGKSLLDMSRMESGVLGNALDGIAEDDEEGSDEKSESSDDKAEDEEKVTDEDTATEAESEELNTEEEAEGEAAEGKEGEEKKEEEDDVSNLQLAWEVLELAKKIFKEEETKEAKLKLADAHLKLGEVSLETEQYESAVGDFKECLAVQETVLDEDDRCLAETHYQLGVAFSLALQYEESIESFKKAQTVMEARVKNLEKVIEEGEKVGKGKDIADFEDPVYKAHKETKELKELLPEIVTKIEDVQEEQKTAEVAKAELKAAVGLEPKPEASKEEGSAFGAGEGSSSAAPTHNITHLVRKKRKTSSSEENCDDAKKAKVENGSGDAPATNGTNGKSASPEKKTETAMETEEVKTKTVEDVKAATEATEAS